MHEPMTDLIKLMSKLVDPNGDILIPGIDDMVPPHDEEELCVCSDSSLGSRLTLCRKLYRKMDYTTDDIEEAAGGKASGHCFCNCLHLT